LLMLAMLERKFGKCIRMTIFFIATQHCKVS